MAGQFRFADSSYLKLFHHSETADGLSELVYDDYPQVRIFRLSNRASVNWLMFLALGFWLLAFSLIAAGFACRIMPFHGTMFFEKKRVKDACRLC